VMCGTWWDRCASLASHWCVRWRSAPIWWPAPIASFWPSGGAKFHRHRLSSHRQLRRALSPGPGTPSGPHRVSMLATARALRARYGADTKIVFIGPCIAKKGEAATLTGPDRIEAVLTFRELRDMLASAGSGGDDVSCRLRPASRGHGRGLPLAARKPADRGHRRGSDVQRRGVGRWALGVPRGVAEFSAGQLNAHLLELLCCRGGCVMGGDERGVAAVCPARADQPSRGIQQAVLIAQRGRPRWSNCETCPWAAASSPSARACPPHLRTRSAGS